MVRNISLSAVVLCAVYAQAQPQPIHVQNNTFNSSYELSPSQVAAANLSTTLANNVEIALNFERSNWATGSIAKDPFYAAPPVNASNPPGTLLAVEEATDTNLYTLAPGLALSRILFVSENFNGTAVPASAYVLWPWMPKLFPKSTLNVSGVPVVAWAHGTSGVHGECAPSHIRNLWYQYSAPYTLALSGYAVVAPDYAGLGVNKTIEGNSVPHEYLAHAAGANDLFFAVKAAQSAFPELSKQFVTMGHSQGGGAAWAAAERQVRTPAEGYLGTVAASPVTNTGAQIAANPTSIVLVKLIAQSIKSILPAFDLAEVFTQQGIQIYRLSEELGACNSVEFQILANPLDWLNPSFAHSQYLNAFFNLTSVGGHPISGPMLVLHGTADPVVNFTVTASVVEQTCALYPESQIEFAAVEGVSHVPVLYASQQVWLEWIADRFQGLDARKECQRMNLKSSRRVESYQEELAYYLQIALESYSVA